MVSRDNVSRTSDSKLVTRKFLSHTYLNDSFLLQEYNNNLSLLSLSEIGTLIK